MNATLYKTSGEIEHISPANSTDFTLDEMYALVGSPVQILRLSKSNQVMIINDEGKLLGLPKNDLATAVWKRAYPIAEYPGNNDELIVGEAIVCDSEMVK